MSEIEFSDEPFEEIEQPAPRSEVAKPAAPRTREKKKTQTTPPYKQGVLIEPLTVGYGFLGMGVGVLEAKSGKFHMPVGSAIVESAEKCAQAWDEAARTSPAIRRVMYKLVNSSNAMKIVVAHAPIAVAVSNEIPAVQRLSRRVGDFFQRMVNVNVDDAEFPAGTDGEQYAYPDGTYA